MAPQPFCLEGAKEVHWRSKGAVRTLWMKLWAFEPVPLEALSTSVLIHSALDLDSCPVESLAGFI